MNSFYNNGYQETIQKGLSAVRSFRSGISIGAGSRNEQIERLKKEIESANAIVIGDRKSTRLNSSHPTTSRMPSSA